MRRAYRSMPKALYVCETCAYSCLNVHIHGDIESRPFPIDSCPNCGSRDFAPEQ